MRIHKDLRTLAKKLKKAGWTVEVNGRGHVKFTSPVGAVVSTSATPSDWRSFKNFKATLRREHNVAF